MQPLPIELGAVAWFDPQTFAADLDAGAIVSVTDRIGGVVCTSAVVGDRPVYLPPLPNGQPAMDFDGTQETSGPGLAALDASDWAIYTVCHPQSGDFGFSWCIGQLAPGTQSAGAQRAGDYRMSISGVSGANVTFGAAAARPVWQRATRQVGVGYTAQQLGGALATAADIVVGVSMVSFGARVNLAQRNNGTVQDWIAFDRVLSPAEDAALLAWLNARYLGFP